MTRRHLRADDGDVIRRERIVHELDNRTHRELRDDFHVDERRFVTAPITNLYRFDNRNISYSSLIRQTRFLWARLSRSCATERRGWTAPNHLSNSMVPRTAYRTTTATRVIVTPSFLNSNVSRSA